MIIAHVKFNTCKEVGVLEYTPSQNRSENFNLQLWFGISLLTTPLLLQSIAALLLLYIALQFLGK